MAESLDKHERDRDRSPSSCIDSLNGNGSATLSARPDLGNNRQPVLGSGTTSSLSESDQCLSLDTRNGGAYRPSGTTQKPTQLSNCDAGDEYFIAQSTHEREDDCDDMCPANPPNSPTIHSLDTRSMRRYLHYEATVSPGRDLLEHWSLSYTGYERKDGIPSVRIRVRYSLALDPGRDSAGASGRVDVPEADSEQWCWEYADARVDSLGMDVAEVTTTASLDFAATTA